MNSGRTRIAQVVVALVVVGLAIVGLFLPMERAEERAVRERIAIDAQEDVYLYNGADLYVYSGDHTSQVAHVDGATGNLDVEGTLDVAGSISSGTGAYTVTDNVFVDGAADAVQLLVQGYTTPTTAIAVFESSDGTDVIAFQEARLDAGSWDYMDVTDTLPILNGSDAVIGIDLNITGANHTGSGNTIYGIDLDLTTADADASEVAIELSDTDWDTGIQGAVNLEHIGFPTIASASVVTTSTDGALFTIGDGEVWIVHSVFVNVTTNFDCTGDDCTMIIGDGNDTDGFIVLADAEMQTADTEGTGFAAGWQGLVPATQGVYIDSAAGSSNFIYAPSGAAETIDVDVGGTAVAAGAATVYVVYTRIQ